MLLTKEQFLALIALVREYRFAIAGMYRKNGRIRADVTISDFDVDPGVYTHVEFFLPTEDGTQENFLFDEYIELVKQSIAESVVQALCHKYLCKFDSSGPSPLGENELPEMYAKYCLDPNR